MDNVYEKLKRRDRNALLGQIGIYLLVFIVSFCINTTRNYLAGILLILLAVEIYLFFSIRARDLLDMMGVFCGVWIFCIGLCMFRLSYVQQPWLVITWLTFALVPLLFGIAFCGIQYIFSEKHGAEKIEQCLGKWIEYRPSQKVYVIEAISCGGIAIVLMMIQYAIKGYFPMFSTDIQARFNFYTKLIIFVVATQASVPMIMKLLYKKSVRIGYKILLVIGLLGIFSSTLLRVSRGDYILTSLMIMPAAVHFAPKKKQFLALVMVCAFICSGYLFSSSLRRETAANLSESFLMKSEEDIREEISYEEPIITEDPAQEVDSGEVPTIAEEQTQEVDPSEVPTIAEEQTQEVNLGETPESTETPEQGESSNEVPPTTEEIVQEEISQEMDSVGAPIENVQTATTLPKFIIFPYFYLINGFENFDYAVRNCEEFSYGLRQFEPFNVVLRIPGVNETIAQLPAYVNLYSTTSCFITDFYLDFGILYVWIAVFLFGCAVGIMHFYYKRTGGPVATCVYGVAFAVCTLSFFDTWLSFFTTWLFWGTCLILALPYIRIKKVEKTV